MGPWNPILAQRTGKNGAPRHVRGVEAESNDAFGE